MDVGSSMYRRYLDGDEAAFAEIEKLYLEHLTYFIHRYVNDIEEAKDIAIDCLAELVAHPHRFKFQTALKTYLFSIGRNKAINYIKRRNRVTMVDLDEVEKSLDYVSIEEEVLADERKRTVNEAVAKLPEEMRIAVHLVYFEDQSYEEAARIMKKSKKQIYNLIYRAKVELRSILGKDGEFLY